ncbi:hypothetical protein N7474_003193 [Penicillium riverlandense]|uniref:uncharacterized protein n=1 Tax=Penicillium riverlandense TaxID=1903569 RepID=UPI0025482825|nr:uncharacterized protein N7474_003193 [Penicillium riverlandense]KAJ5826055.1 hypothetical protein N7474_003193 [Penicillium riverlandense]
MLRDADIDALNSHVSSLSRENEQHHASLQDLLTQFRSLLDDYSALKSDYEEVKDGREKYKKQARGQFKEHFVKAGSEGGINAARELSDSIKELMHSTMGAQADQCRIMVRVYANLLGLSKAFARAGLSGHEARSLSPFCAAFTRAQDLFDFVDAAEKKEGSDFKIREMFRLFADLNQCRHIYFAGCHDTGYGSLLTPHRGSDRITLIKAASFHRDFESLGLPIRELPSVFTSAPLANTNGSIKPAASINGKPKPVPTAPTVKPGICKFGNGCIKQHIMPNQQLSPPHEEEKSASKQLWSAPSVVGRSEEFFQTTLPLPSLKSEEFIPVNKDGDRIDTYCPPPNQEAFEEYHRRAKLHKVCNSYHLSGECGDMSCPFDHSDVSDTIIDVLRHMLLQHPCSRGRACRSIKCYLGHMCQKPGCKAVKSWQCRFNQRAHTLDLQVAQWVTPMEHPDVDPFSPSGSSTGDTSPSTIYFG